MSAFLHRAPWDFSHPPGFVHVFDLSDESIEASHRLEIFCAGQSWRDGAYVSWMLHSKSVRNIHSARWLSCSGALQPGERDAFGFRSPSKAPFRSRSCRICVFQSTLFLLRPQRDAREGAAIGHLGVLGRWPKKRCKKPGKTLEWEVPVVIFFFLMGLYTGGDIAGGICLSVRFSD